MADLLVSGGDTERPWQRDQPEHDGVPRGPPTRPAGDASTVLPRRRAATTRRGPRDRHRRRPRLGRRAGGPGDATRPGWPAAARSSRPPGRATPGSPTPGSTPPRAEPGRGRAVPRARPPVRAACRSSRRAGARRARRAAAEPEPADDRAARHPDPAGPPPSSRVPRPDLLPSVARSQRGARRRNQPAPQGRGRGRRRRRARGRRRRARRSDPRWRRLGPRGPAAAARPRPSRSWRSRWPRGGQLTGVSLLAGGPGGAAAGAGAQPAAARRPGRRPAARCPARWPRVPRRPARPSPTPWTSGSPAPGCSAPPPWPPWSTASAASAWTSTSTSRRAPGRARRSWSPPAATSELNGTQAAAYAQLLRGGRAGGRPAGPPGAGGHRPAGRAAAGRGPAPGLPGRAAGRPEGRRPERRGRRSPARCTRRPRATRCPRRSCRCATSTPAATITAYGLDDAAAARGGAAPAGRCRGAGPGRWPADRPGAERRRQPRPGGHGASRSWSPAG